MAKLTGMDGVLRVYDSSAILLGTAPRDDATVDIVTWDGSTTYANITAAVDTDDTSYSSDFLTDNDDAVFIGADVSFAMIQFKKDGASQYAVSSGALKAYYFDGTNFDNTVTATDGTATGADCFVQDGYITFKVPEGWALGANAVSANLDSDKYYIKLMTTTSPSTDPDADILCPVDGQFFEVAFANMDFNGPLGRTKTEEILVLNRMRMDANAHYIEGPDSPIYDPLPTSFSAALDDTLNKNDIQIALACGDPDSANWTATGTSSKGDTKNDGTNANPSFAESTKKTVNIQMLFGTMGVGWAYYEVFVPEDQVTFAESESDVPITVNAGVYGVIELIHGFGVRH